MRAQTLAIVFALLAVTPAAAQAPALNTQELRSIIDERDKAYNQRFDAQEKAVAAALAASKEAVNKAEMAAEKRFDSVNEFRGQLKDQTGTLMPRTEVITLMKGIEDKIRALEEKEQGNDAKITAVISRGEGASSLWGVLTGFVGLAAGLAVAFVALRKPSPR